MSTQTQPEKTPATSYTANSTVKRTYRKYPIYLFVITVVIIIGLYLILRPYAPSNTTVRIAVATEDIQPRELITSGAYEWKRVDTALIGEGTFVEGEDNPASRATRTFIPKGTPIYAGQVATEARVDSISIQLTTGIAYRIPLSWLDNSLPPVEEGDRIDLITAAGNADENASAAILVQAPVILVETDGDDREAVVVEISREDAGRLVYARSQKLLLQGLVYPYVTAQAGNDSDASDTTDDNQETE